MSDQAIPRVASAALVSVPASGPKRALPFQYNPDTLRRSYVPNTVGGRPSERTSAVRFAGAAAETLTMDCRFAVADSSRAAEEPRTGIAPLLAALTLLAYPSVADVTAQQTLLDSGTIEVLPPEADLLLLVWGGQWTLPVRILELSVVEQLFDAELRPVIATVSLSLRAVTYSDVTPPNGAFDLFLAYQRTLESLAAGAWTTSTGQQ